MHPSSHTKHTAGSLARSSRFFYLVTDPDGNIVDVNPFFQKQFSHITIEFRGKKASGIFLAESGDKLKQALQNCLANPETVVPVDLNILSAGGFPQTIYWELSICNNGSDALSIQAIGFAPNAAIANGSEHHVAELIERYSAYEHSSEALWCFDLKEPVPASATPDRIIDHCRTHAFLTDCNDRMARLHGYHNPAELIGRKMENLLNLNDPDWIEYLKAFIVNDFRGSRVETKEHDRDGKALYFVNTMEGVVENGLLKRIWGTQQDITEKRTAIEQINYLVKLLNTVSDIIISQDKDFRVISWNKAAEIAYGYPASEMIGREIREVLHFEYEGITRTRFFELVHENGEWHGEAYVVNRFGRPITLLASITKIRNAKGETTGYVSVSKDITEKRKMEERLEQSELFYRNLFANSLDGVLITDDRGIIRFASSSITPILGYSETEVMEKSVFNYVHLEDRPLAVMAFMDEMSGNLKEKFVSLRLQKKTGEWLWCYIRGHNLTKNPYISGVVIYFHDDTTRRETEAALIESEQRFRYQATILNNVTDIILTTDTNSLITSWNKVLERLSGIMEEDAIGKPIREILNWDYSPFTADQVAAIVIKDGIWRGEMSIQRYDGQRVYLLHTISLLHNQDGHYIGYLGVGKDITERKKAEKQLQESEQFYRNMSYYSFDGIVMADEKGRVIYCGPSIQRISGYEHAQLLGRNVFEFIHPDDISAALEGFTAEINKQSELSYMQMRLKHRRGEWVWCTVRTHNLLDTPGFNAMVIYFTDDTKRKEAEDKLRKSEENFRNLIYNLKHGVLLMDKNRIVTICNKALLDMYGLTEDQVLGRDPLGMSADVIHEDGSHFPEREFPINISLSTKKGVHDVVMGLSHYITGDRIWGLVNTEVLLDQDGEIINIICSITDITERKRLTRELFEQEVQKQKLLMQATIDGQEKERMQMGKELHDNINQHLTTTRLYLEVAAEKANGEVLEMIQLSHKTLADIIYEIRQLSQSLVPPTLGDIGLIESIQELCESLKRAHAFHIDFYHPFFTEEELPANLKLMLYRITQEQVNNIIRHAHAAHLHIKLQSDAEYINLTISDDGIGFDSGHYKKGMGFSNIVARADLFNGKVEIDTAPGKGCRLSVIIPLEGLEEPLN